LAPAFQVATIGRLPAALDPSTVLITAQIRRIHVAMNENELLARYGLVPVTADLPEIRRMIEALTADDKRDSNEPLKTLCIQLFSAGIASDALLIYKAKTSSFDAACYIDIQLACGADLEATKAFLHESGADEAKALLAVLNKSNQDFEGFTPEGHLDFYRRYHGLSS
jgi:hypothetical protein